jgi:ATP-dependent RNA helicase DHX8/PRP22
VSQAKERRELRQAQANQLIDSIPKDLNRPWEDPLPEAGERHFAQELRSINMSSFDGAPEWKKKAENKTLSYGIISNKSLKEQRESLPIYRLKSELLEAITNNQVLVVIGETGSGKTTQMTQYLVELGMTKKAMITARSLVESPLFRGRVTEVRLRPWARCYSIHRPRRLPLSLNTDGRRDLDNDLKRYPY